MCFGAALVLVSTVYAQPSPRPAFEAASIKPNPNCRQVPNAGPSAGRLDLPCITPRMLIRAAYGGFSGGKLNTRFLDVVGGPGWLDSEWYAVTAKSEGKASAAQMMGPLLQALLEERFQVKVHIEVRESPVYVLTVAKDGKLAAAKEGSCVPIDPNHMPQPDASQPMPKFCGNASVKRGAGGFVAEIPGITMEELAGRMLPGYVGRPVVDQTGLAGRFDVHLEFALPGREVTDGAPSIFVAMQEQLGLKLSAGKAAMDVIVVDSAAKPTAD